MKKPEQIPLFEEAENRIPRQVEYVPPDSSAITALVKATCEQLGKQNAAYNDPEVIGGLTSFLDFLAQRLVTYANNGCSELLVKKHPTSPK